MSTTDPREQRPVWPPETQRPSDPSSHDTGPDPAPSTSTTSTTSASSATGNRAPSAAARTRASSNGAALWVAALVLGLVLGAGGMKLIDNAGEDGGDALAGNVDESRFQAVILTNDKVYFGRLTEVSDTFFRLDDAFFLRETRENADAEPVRALLPVNRELHAPENSLLIRQDEVVLVENLDEESPLLDEIERQTGANGS